MEGMKRGEEREIATKGFGANVKEEGGGVINTRIAPEGSWGVEYN